MAQDQPADMTDAELAAETASLDRLYPKVGKCSHTTIQTAAKLAQEIARDRGQPYGDTKRELLRWRGDTGKLLDRAV